MTFRFITPLDTPDYEDHIDGLASASWPVFMLEDPIANEHWGALFDCFPEYQFALVDETNGRIAAMGNSLPLHWSGDPHSLPEEGWDWALQQAVADYHAGRTPRTQCAIQVAIHPDYRSQGLSVRMVKRMRAIGVSKGFQRLVAPVRPSQKSLYPLTPIERYITWQTTDGLPFDAWLRVHARLGAAIIAPCRRSMTIRAPAADWESWTGMRFPESGPYIIPGALTPVIFDLASGEGVYYEPNVWMEHRLSN